MPYSLPEDRMPEAEVSLRLAFHLLELPTSQGVARVAIDGAQVKVGQDHIFPIADFLTDMGWRQIRKQGLKAWQGEYTKGNHHLVVHSLPGEGDVVAQVGDQCIRAECKGGPLTVKAGSREYPILRGALGQALTMGQVAADDVLIVAVPLSHKFRELAGQWRNAPLVRCTRIRIVLVSRDDTVEGLDIQEQGCPT